MPAKYFEMQQHWSAWHLVQMSFEYIAVIVWTHPSTIPTRQTWLVLQKFLLSHLLQQQLKSPHSEFHLLPLYHPMLLIAPVAATAILYTQTKSRLAGHLSIQSKAGRYQELLTVNIKLQHPQLPPNPPRLLSLQKSPFHLLHLFIRTAPGAGVFCILCPFVCVCFLSYS